MVQNSRKGMLSGRNGSRKPSAIMNRGSKLNELLADEEVVKSSEAGSMKQRGNDKKASFANFVINAFEYDYPRIGQVPATYYRSVIADMQVRDKEGKEILDVCYDIEDQYGREYHILQSYPMDSRPFKQLAAALLAAGVPRGETANAGIGVCEIINLDYVSKNSDFGSIVERKPYVCTSTAEDEDTDEDEEFSDFLPDDED